MRHRSIPAAIALAATLAATDASAQWGDQKFPSLDGLTTVLAFIVCAPNVAATIPTLVHVGFGRRATGWGVASVLTGSVTLLAAVPVAIGEDSARTEAVWVAGVGALSVGAGIWNLLLPAPPDAPARPRSMVLPAVLATHESRGYGLALHVTAF